MHQSGVSSGAGGGGIAFCPTNAGDAARIRQRFLGWLEVLGLLLFVVEADTFAAIANTSWFGLHFSLAPEFAAAWAQDQDTSGLASVFGLDTLHNNGDLEREIVLAMLLGPVPFRFPSFDEFRSSVRIRCNIVQAARKTALSFDTQAAERPPGYWTYDEATGFTVLPGKCLIEALRKATQPEVSGKRYSFSCYRATEYVILLALAEELARCNPELLAGLQRQWECRAIMSGRFHEVFLYEYGTMDAPLPRKYYVPGDRLWFRNPDPHSSDVSGYEGSWVFYLGNGLFSNFWKYDQPYTLVDKCLEIYHWRHAVTVDAAGELQIDESIVEARVAASRADEEASARICEAMLQYREPQGVYRGGGCIDTSREFPRRVCPGTADIELPSLQPA